jgi:hypothetical protein
MIYKYEWLNIEYKQKKTTSIESDQKRQIFIAIIDIK